MIDENGDTADMFMPFSTLEEDEIPVTSSLLIDDDGEDSPRVIGQPARAESVTNPISKSEKPLWIRLKSL